MAQSVVGFIIDTNRYAGNFEREMCAFMTGMIGDCEVGYEYAERFLEDYDHELDFVTDKADESGCYRPVQIYPTPGLWNNGMGFAFTEGQEELALEKYKESMISYITQNLNRLSPSQKTPDAIKEAEDKIQACKEKTVVDKWDAFHSVLIHVHREPTPEEIQFLNERAELFAKEKGIEITGYRLLLEENKSNTHSI